MTALRLAAALLIADAARALAAAQQTFAPLHKTATGEAVPTGDGAMLWLALAAVAMVATLYAAHWSIFRKK